MSSGRAIVLLVATAGCHSLPTLQPVVFANSGIQMKLTELAWPEPAVDATYNERGIVRHRGADWEFTFIAEVTTDPTLRMVLVALSDLGGTEFSARFERGTVTIDRPCPYLADAVVESLVWDHAVVLLGPLGHDPRLVTISSEVPGGWALEYRLDSTQTLLYQKQRDDGGRGGGPGRRGSGRVHRMVGNSIEGTVHVLHGGFRAVKEFEIESHRYQYSASILITGRE